MTTLREHIITHRKALLNRDFLLDLFTIIKKEEVVDTGSGKYLLVRQLDPYIGKIVSHLGQLSYISKYTKLPSMNWNVEIKPISGITTPPNTPLLVPNDPLDISGKDIENYTGKDTIQTTYGRYVMNYIVLAYPFGNTIPYVNNRWSPSTIYDAIYKHLIDTKITIDQYYTFVRSNYYIGQFTELSVPAFTRKSLTTSPNMVKIRQELVAKYGDQLKAKNPIAMSTVESALIAEDRKYLTGDPASRYLLSNKAFNVQRKKLLTTTGMVETFGTPGDFSFISNPLSEGWAVKDFPVLINEIRAGSHGRAIDTAIGGEDSKFIMRIFQNSRITEDDCGTKRTLKVDITDYNYNEYVYRYIIDNGALIETSQAYLKEKIGKSIHMRSPQMCEVKNGYCFTCMGGVFKTLNQRALGMTAVAIGSYFLTERMKGMHGKSVTTINVNNLDNYTY